MWAPRALFQPGGGGETERGQSEVIGVILLVAIAIVMGAVAGQFVFGLNIIQGQDQTVGPQVSFSTTADGEILTVEHQSGAVLETSEITVIGTETGAYEVDWSTEEVGDDDKWEAGESITIDREPGETVRVVWESSTTGDSTVILKEQYSE